MTKEEIIEKYNLVNLAEYDYYGFQRWGWHIGNMMFPVIDDVTSNAVFCAYFKFDPNRKCFTEGLPATVNLNKNLFIGKNVETVKEKWIDNVICAYRKDVENYIEYLNNKIAEYEKAFAKKHNIG